MTGVPVKLRGTPGGVSTPPPLLGQHTAELLAELGYDDAAIDELRAAKWVATDADIRRAREERRR